jgi:hypothetical protein
MAGGKFRARWAAFSLSLPDCGGADLIMKGMRKTSSGIQFAFTS